MDLGAYANIENLEEIVAKNGIEVPRLRGYRLMSKEEPISDEDIKQRKKDDELDICEWLIRADWRVGACGHELSDRTDRNCRKYLYNKTEICENFQGEEYVHYIPVGIKWNKIHGKRRKNLKWEIRKNNKAVDKQFNMFNKYAGKKDVLMIHARIGGVNGGCSNWNYFGGEELKKKSWFLDAVDDAFDCTYCDIYAKINMEE